MSYPRLKDLREDKDLSQADIANKINTSQSYYAQYENGKRPIPFERVIELADFYYVSIDYIAGRSNTKKNVNLTISSSDAVLLRQFNRLTEKQQGIILGRIEQMTEDNKKPSNLGLIRNPKSTILPKK